MKEQLVYLGVDIAKSYLDAAVWNEKRRFSNDAIGHRELIKWVNRRTVHLEHGRVLPVPDAVGAR